MQSKKENDLLMRLPHAACRVFFFFPVDRETSCQRVLPPPPEAAHKDLFQPCPPLSSPRAGGPSAV